jgi:hypothetical protein
MEPPVEDESIHDSKEIYLNEKCTAEVEQFRIKMEEDEYLRSMNTLIRWGKQI